jgi:hypothetical protein
MKSFAKHLPHFITLFGILFAAFAGLILFSYEKRFQMAISVALACSYVSWGIVHHLLHKDFSLEVLFEYIAVAALGLVIIISLVIRA